MFPAQLIQEPLDRMASPRLFIFGYGSLIWCPGFPYARRTVGCVPGYKRRFYQGSVCHRGTPELPGRVATLLPDPGSSAWGVLYEVVGAESVRAALGHLTEREARLGGYRLREVRFHPLAESESEATGSRAYTFVADPSNPQYLGKATLDLQARQVASAVGPAGGNDEYVRRVAQFMAREVPGGAALDPHLSELSRRVDSITGSAGRSAPSPLPAQLQSPAPPSLTSAASEAVCLTAC